MSDDITNEPALDAKSKRPIKGGLYYLAFLLVAALVVLFVAGGLL